MDSVCLIITSCFSLMLLDYVFDLVHQFVSTPRISLIRKQVTHLTHKTHSNGGSVARLKITLPGTNIARENKQKLVFQPSIFRCELLVSGRVTFWTPQWRFGSDDIPFHLGHFQVPDVDFPGCMRFMVSWRLPSPIPIALGLLHMYLKLYHKKSTS